MSKDYFEVVSQDEARRAFALDCIVEALGSAAGEKLMAGKEYAAKRIVERAKIFETYLAGRE